jgi:hypothetical protein
MDANTPLGMIMLCCGLAFVIYLFYKMAKTFIITKDALCNVGEGILIALCQKLSEAELARKAFYEYPWTPNEAQVMLKEMRRQLASQISFPDTPELLSSIGRDEKALLFTLAVFFKFVISNEEIHQRITFMEMVIARDQSNQPTSERKYSFQLS